MESILIGISKVSTRNGEDTPSLEDLKTQILSEQKNSDYNLLKKLSDRFFSFAPLEQPMDGGWKKEDVLEAISDLKPLVDHKKIFRTALSSDDKAMLRNISNETCDIIKKYLEQQKISNLKFKIFEDVHEHMSFLQEFKILENKEVDSFIDQASILVSDKLTSLANEVKLRCNSDDFDAIDDYISILKRSTQENLFSFNRGNYIGGNLKAIKLKFDFKDLAKYRDDAKKKFDKKKWRRELIDKISTLSRFEYAHDN